VTTVEPFDPLSMLPPKGRAWGINFGGGTNSTALVIESFRRGFRPDWILFCDTGSERPETYAAIDRLSAWCKDRAFTPLSVTRWEREKPLPDGSYSESLEQYCLRTEYMPSKAYGFAGCSTKYKVQPAQRWRKANGFGDSVYAIGFDAGEWKRVSRRKCIRAAEGEQQHEDPWYPLYAWGITRAICRDLIAGAGLPPVAKSACFFCPNNKKTEWSQLKAQHPELFQRSLEIEAKARAAGNARENGLMRSNGFLADFAPDLNWKDETDMSCACYEPSEEP
jgi:hypothetical protein